MSLDFLSKCVRSRYGYTHEKQMLKLEKLGFSKIKIGDRIKVVKPRIINGQVFIVQDIHTKFDYKLLLIQEATGILGAIAWLEVLNDNIEFEILKEAS